MRQLHTENKTDLDLGETSKLKAFFSLSLSVFYAMRHFAISRSFMCSLQVTDLDSPQGQRDSLVYRGKPTKNMGEKRTALG